MERDYVKMARVYVGSVGNCKCYIYSDGRMSYNDTAENIRFSPEEPGDVRSYDTTVAIGE